MSAASGDSFGEPPGVARLRARDPPLIARVQRSCRGEKDTALLTSNLNGLDQVVPNLTVRRIPEGTHWIARENAADVNRFIREFLAQPGGSAKP